MGWTMNKIKTTLLKMVRGIKENMSMLYMGITAIFIPVGVSFLIMGTQADANRLPYMVIGSLSYFIGVFAWFLAYKEYKSEKSEADIKYLTQLRMLSQMGNDYIAEIRNLTNEIRQDRNERRTRNNL